MTRFFLAFLFLYLIFYSVRMFDAVQEMFKAKHAELDREQKKKQTIQ